MKANIKKQIRILFILLLTCSFLYTTGCSGLRDWWGYDASTANSELNQFYYSVRPVKGTVESDYRLARYFQKRGKHKFAVDELLNVIRKDPSFIKAYNALGVSYDCLGQFDLAVKSYKFALQLNPELDYIHNNLGYSYLLNGNLDAAIDAFQKAIAIDGTNKRYHNNLGLAFARKGQTDMAYYEFKLAADDSKLEQTPKDLNLSAAKKETVVDTTPEGISPYDDIQKDKETSLFLATKDQEISTVSLEHRLIPDDLDEIDLFKKSINNEVRNSDLDLSQENTDKKEDLVNYTVQVSASNNLKDASLLMEMLTKRGYPCPYLNKVGNEKLYYRVRIGRFDDKEEIDQFIPDLTHMLGYKPFIAIEDEQAKKILYGKTNCFDTKVNEPSVVIQPFNIEISNGNGVRHMARNLGIYLSPKGFSVNRLTNADHFNYPETKIYYQQGYEQEALQLAKEIPGRQEIPNLIEQDRLMRRSIKVLIGKDLVPFHEYIMSHLKGNSNVAKVEKANKKTS